MRLVRVAAALALLACGGCGYENPTYPSVATPGSVLVPSQVTLGAVLGIGADAGTAAVTAHVLNENGTPLPNVVVDFATTRGALAPAHVTTGAGGTATATLTASDTADVTASVGPLSAHTLVVAVAPTPTTPTPTPTPSPSPTPTTPVPAVFLNGPSSATVGDTVTFTVSSSATGVTWNWSFGDGSAPVLTTAFSATHMYASAGTFPVTVSSPTTASASATITVNAASVVVTPNPFAATLTCTAGLVNALTTCNVVATYKGAAIPSTQITRVTFDWGDGNLNIVPTPVASYPYQKVGSYVVIAAVEAKAADGSSLGSASASSQVTVCTTRNTSTGACTS